MLFQHRQGSIPLRMLGPVEQFEMNHSSATGDHSHANRHAPSPRSIPCLPRIGDQPTHAQGPLTHLDLMQRQLLSQDLPMAIPMFSRDLIKPQVPMYRLWDKETELGTPDLLYYHRQELRTEGEDKNRSVLQKINCVFLNEVS